MKTIALITDFGAVDGFVGVMKGVIGTIAPDARVVDISHDSSPQHIQQASFVLWTSFKYFPAETIFIVVVDPGVGSDRRIILVEDAKGYRFLYPENGILDFILPELNAPGAYHIDNRDYWLDQVSTTFHGRDIFAPVAAHLANGVSPAKLGTPMKISIPQSQFLDPELESGDAYGRILHVDRFGNLITNFRPGGNGVDALGAFSVLIGNRSIREIRKNYAEVEHGDLIALVGSSGLIEVAVRNGSAHQLLGLRIGDPVVLRR